MADYSFANFFFSYGLFLLKAITIIALIVVGLVFFASILALKSKSKESLEIKRINEHYDSLRDTLEAEIYTKEEYKLLKKLKKKQEKHEQRERNKKAKLVKKLAKPSSEAELIEKLNEQERDRLYVLYFFGDLHASEVDNLREAITALLLIMKPSDQVLVVLESSGGLVHNYGLAASQLRRIREHKINLTVAVDLVAASGGYMMACVADRIIAAPFAVLGSIGVLAQLPNFNRLLTKHDIEIEHHTAGEHKTTLTMLGKNTSQARDKFREDLDDTHKLFKEFVSSNRPQVNINNIATGEHWYGSRALDLQLIDEIKTSDDYLLEKSKELDIFEVSYEYHETFKEKMENMIVNTATKLTNTIRYKFGSLLQWKT